jgi:hypothetical protein
LLNILMILLHYCHIPHTPIEDVSCNIWLVHTICAFGQILLLKIFQFQNGGGEPKYKCDENEVNGDGQHSDNFSSNGQLKGSKHATFNVYVWKSKIDSIFWSCILMFQVWDTL